MDFNSVQKRKLAFVLWTLFIAVVTLTPLPAGGPAAPATQVDKIAHFALFFIFAFLAARIRGARTWENYLLIIAAAVAYGGLIEYLQLYVPGRESDMLDIVADALGALSLCIMAPTVLKK
ncbi:MAG: VanZ family protein [Candidatus Aenigmatarchaeota archaeon]|nr:MAG: VanZ family protein [Candidatus Aenigmarchaeota archaeon]